MNGTCYLVVTRKLYIYCTNGIFWLCFDDTKVSSVVKAYDVNTYNKHFLGDLIAQKVLLVGYFKPPLFINAEDHTKK
jgi:hypothetical protein